jgi:hypothetical protein
LKAGLVPTKAFAGNLAGDSDFGGGTDSGFKRMEHMRLEGSQLSEKMPLENEKIESEGAKDKGGAAIPSKIRKSSYVKNR